MAETDVLVGYAAAYKSRIKTLRWDLVRRALERMGAQALRRGRHGSTIYRLGNGKTVAVAKAAHKAARGPYLKQLLEALEAGGFAVPVFLALVGDGVDYVSPDPLVEALMEALSDPDRSYALDTDRGISRILDRAEQILSGEADAIAAGEEPVHFAGIVEPLPDPPVLEPVLEEPKPAPLFNRFPAYVVKLAKEKSSYGYKALKTALDSDLETGGPLFNLVQEAGMLIVKTIHPYYFFTAEGAAIAADLLLDMGGETMQKDESTTAETETITGGRYRVIDNLGLELGASYPAALDKILSLYNKHSGGGYPKLSAWLTEARDLIEAEGERFFCGEADYVLKRGNIGHPWNYLKDLIGRPHPDRLAKALDLEDKTPSAKSARSAVGSILAGATPKDGDEREVNLAEAMHRLGLSGKSLGSIQVSYGRVFGELATRISDNGRYIPIYTEAFVRRSRAAYALRRDRVVPSVLDGYRLVQKHERGEIDLGSAVAAESPSKAPGMVDGGILYPMTSPNPLEPAPEPTAPAQAPLTPTGEEIAELAGEIALRLGVRFVWSQGSVDPLETLRRIRDHVAK